MQQRQQNSDEADTLARRLGAGVKIQDEWRSHLYPHFSQNSEGVPRTNFRAKLTAAVT